VGGALGAILTDAFAKHAIDPLSHGWLFDGNGRQMPVQLADVAGIFA
jgi:hypothetical protein